MSVMGEPSRKEESGLEKGDERLGRRTPCGGNPGGGYMGRPAVEEAGSDLEPDLGGEDPGLEPVGEPPGPGLLGGDPGGDLDPGTWAETRAGPRSDGLNTDGS